MVFSNYLFIASKSSTEKAFAPSMSSSFEKSVSSLIADADDFDGYSVIKARWSLFKLGSRAASLLLSVADDSEVFSLGLFCDLFLLWFLLESTDEARWYVLLWALDRGFAFLASGASYWASFLSFWPSTSVLDLCNFKVFPFFAFFCSSPPLSKVAIILFWLFPGANWLDCSWLSLPFYVMF